MTESEEGPVCANCGAPVSGRGTPSPVDGSRFCTTRRACINAKAALRRAQRLGPAAMEVRPCFACGKELPERPARKTDSPLGRWCRDADCQRKREYEFTMHGIKEREFLEAEIEPCSVCGLETARVGWDHIAPHPPFRACNGPTGWVGKFVNVKLIIDYWPEIVEARRAALAQSQ